jgi:Transposase
VKQSHILELQSFVAGVEKDKEAVKAGLTWWINNGVVEGHVTKLKLIKRQGYGRAGFLLLRKRILHAMEPRPRKIVPKESWLNGSLHLASLERFYHADMSFNFCEEKFTQMSI